MAELGATLIGALLVNNFVLAQFLGLCPFFGTTRQYDTALATGLATLFVLCLSAALCYVINRYVLAPLDLGYLRIIAFIVVVAATVQLTEIYLRATSRVLYQVLGLYLPLITSNCAVLGVALIATNEGRDFMATLALAAGAALGFTLVMVLFAAMRERLATANVPKAMQGTPVTLLTAGIMSLAFMGFQGIGQ